LRVNAHWLAQRFAVARETLNKNICLFALFVFNPSDKNAAVRSSGNSGSPEFTFDGDTRTDSGWFATFCGTITAGFSAILLQPTSDRNKTNKNVIRVNLSISFIIFALCRTFFICKSPYKSSKLKIQLLEFIITFCTQKSNPERLSGFSNEIRRKDMFLFYNTFAKIFSGQIVPPYFVVAILNNFNIQTRFRRFQVEVEIGEGIASSKKKILTLG